jgi:hypothetical protein
MFFKFFYLIALSLYLSIHLSIYLSIYLSLRLEGDPITLWPTPLMDVSGEEFPSLLKSSHITQDNIDKGINNNHNNNHNQHSNNNNNTNNSHNNNSNNNNNSNISNRRITNPIINAVRHRFPLSASLLTGILNSITLVYISNIYI